MDDLISKSERSTNNISRLSVRALLFNHFLMKGIQTEEELYGYIKEFLGFEIPLEDICTHHVAPWKALSDIFFEREHSTFLFGSRSSGKTRMLSILNNCEATFKPKIQICNAGAIITQAQRNYEYTLSYYEDDLLASTLKNSIQSHTELTNGSVISVISGSMRGFNGAHPSLVYSTPVSLPCDRSIWPEGIPIGRLFDRGKPFLVWSYSRRHQRPVLRKATAHLSGKDQKVYRVTYGWWGGDHRSIWQEDSIDCTEEHPFLMRDGTYKRLRQLSKGASLMPVNFTQKKLGDSLGRYVRLSGPLHDDVYEHREVYQHVSGSLLKAEDVVHHKDGNSLNNNYANLELMTFSEHSKEHHIPLTPEEGVDLSKTVIKSMTGRSVKSQWHDKEWLYHQYVIQQKTARDIGADYGTSCQTISKWLKKHGIVIRDAAEQALISTGRSASVSQLGGLTDKFLFDQYVTRKKSGAEIARDVGLSISTVCKYLREYNIPLRDSSETRKLAYKDNHEILSIEYVGREDVYNLEVEGTHNYISKSLVHHNCKLRLDEIELIDWYCLGGNSLIDVIRNRSIHPNGVAIKDLLGKTGQYVYCYDVKEKKYHLRRIIKVKKTGFKKVLKIHYWWLSGRKVKVRKEGSVIVTHSHRMMLFNGEYREAGSLEVNDRLKAFAQINVDPDSHPRINVSPTRSNVVEHQFIWEEVHGPVPPGHVIHHKDYNKWNSELSNLELMTYSEHLYEHHHGVKRSKLTKEKIRLAAKHRGEEWKDKLRTSRLDYWKTQVATRPWVDKEVLREAVQRFALLSDLAKEWDCSLETLRVWSRKHGITYRDPSEVGRVSGAKRTHGKPYTDKDALEAQYVDQRMTIKDIAQYHSVCWDTILAWLKRHDIKRRPSVSSSEYVPEENHKIFKIEEFGFEDVYGMEVEEHHNFVAEGIVVKNSIQEAFSMSQSTDKWSAQDTLSSTRKFSAGSVQRLLDEAKERAIAVYPWCLIGRMKVRTPEGDFPIRDLVGKEFLVYSRHPDTGELVLRKAKHVRKTRRSARVFKITYEWWAGRDGRKTGEMVCTGNHRILMRDGSYAETLDLVEGDSLMPFYKKKNENLKNFDKYYEVGFTGSKTVRESRFVWEQVNGPIPADYVVHHKDGDDFNNHVDNLHVELRADHSESHTKKWWADSDFDHIQARNNRVAVKKRERDARVKIGNQSNHKVVSVEFYGHEDVYDLEVEETHNFACEDIFVHNCIWESLQKCTRLCKADPVYGDCPIYSKIDVKTGKEVMMCGGKAHQCVVGSTLIDMPRDLAKYPKGIPIKDLVGKEFPTYGYDIKNRRVVIRKAKHVRLIHKNAKTVTVKFISSMCESVLSVTPDHRFLLTSGRYKRADSLLFNDRLEAFKSFGAVLVLSVTESEPEDVYCMEVEGVHNFVANGVFVENCSGWYPIEDLIKKIRLLDINTWRAQWLCERAGDASTVFGEFFSEEMHVLPTEEAFLAKFRELEGEPLRPQHFRIAGIDFGGSFAYVRLVKSPSYKRRFYVMQVYFNKKDVVLGEHIKFIKKFKWWGKGKEVIFGDPAARQDQIEFRNEGIPVRLAEKNVFSGLNLLKSLLENQDDGRPGIFINGPECQALINEFGSYSYKTSKSGLPDLDNIFKNNDHCIDALRYALYSYIKGGFRVRTRTRANF